MAKVYEPRDHGENVDRELQDPVILLGEVMQLRQDKKSGKYEPFKKIENKMLAAIDEMYHAIDKMRQEVLTDTEAACLSSGADREITVVESEMIIH